MRFGPKWNAFWPKMESVLAQNGKCFGPKWNAFWAKMQSKRDMTFFICN